MGNYEDAVEAKDYFWELRKKETMTQTKQIEGIPVGCRLVRIGAVMAGEWVLDWEGVPYTFTGYDGGNKNYVIVAPDNVYTVYNLTSVAIPAGYERDGEKIEEWFREPQAEEWFLTTLQNAVKNTRSFRAVYEGKSGDYRRIILRPIAPKTKKVLVVEFEDPSDSLLNYWSESMGTDGKTNSYFKRTVTLQERPI